MGETVLDLGAGTGAVGLAVALHAPGARVVLVERDPALAGLCAQNAALNGLSERVEVAAADLLDPRSRRASGLIPADLVVTNPPFLDPLRSRASPVAARAAAHSAGAGGLAAWLAAALALLRPGGRLALIHRADALEAVLAGLAGRFGALRITPVHPRDEAPAIRLLVTGIRGSRAPLSLRPALVLHGPDGAFLPRAAALHAGEALLDDAEASRTLVRSAALG